MRRRFVILSAIALLSSVAALAQAPQPVRVRGKIASVEGTTLLIASRSGEQVSISLPEQARISSVHPVPLASIGQNSYVGVSAEPGKDGVLHALEVHVFPDTMRGTAEGHTPWDLTPASTMTNGSVSGVVSSAAGRTLDVTYKGESVKIDVPEDTPVVGFGPAARDDLKPGTPVIVFGVKQPDGALQARNVVVGKDGATPPM